MKQRLMVGRARKTPSVSRTPTRSGARRAVTGAWLLVLSSLSVHSARAQVLTEAEIVRRARTSDPQVLAARAGVSVAAAREVGAALLPNPTLAWQRDQFLGSPARAESEDAIMLSVPVGGSDRRAARRALVRSEVAERRAAATRSQSAAIEQALTLFYAALATEQSATIARQTLQQLTHATRVLDRRRAEGTASGYEYERLAIETELQHSELLQAEGRAAAQRRELLSVLDLPAGEVVLQGDLRLNAAPRALERARELALRRPSLAQARDAAAQARIAGDAADSAWIPPLTLSGGLLAGNSTVTRYGYVAGVSVALPLFARGQELRAEADAELHYADSLAHAAERTAQLEATRAIDALTLAKNELARFEAATVTRVQQLQRAAQSGYREGQRTVLELLDAERTRTAVERRKLELALMAKHAEIALRAAEGEFE